VSAVGWKVGGEEYLPELAALEETYQIPQDLLARIAFQESSWRNAVIDYAIESPAGAIGIMQLIPRFFPSAGVGWQSDSEIAAQELVRLFLHYNDWQKAVAAYNWGEANVDKWNGQFAALPTETQNYVTDVFTDVPVQGAIINV
jgi:soluble lytic murein transglycosylase-like protein